MPEKLSVVAARMRYLYRELLEQDFSKREALEIVKAAASGGMFGG